MDKIAKYKLILFKSKNSPFKVLKDNQVQLTKEERAECIKRKAVWHMHMGRNKTRLEVAVWKSKHPKTGKITYVTNTHRAYNTAPTLKGAIARFHNFIKGTA